MGDVIGEWTVLEYVGKHHVRAQCSCGVSKRLYLYTLGTDSLSCGHSRRTGPRSRLIWMWKWMHSRCYNPGDPMYQYYGMRGIEVCQEWHNAESYVEWALEHGWKKSSRLQIDRIDNDGNYSPDNCRVVSNVINANNKSNNVIVEAFGERKTVAEWSRDSRCAVSYATFTSRLRRGCDPELALINKLYKR